VASICWPLVEGSPEKHWSWKTFPNPNLEERLSTSPVWCLIKVSGTFFQKSSLMIERRRCNCPRIRSCQTWSHRVGEATLLDCGLAIAEGADNTARRKLFQTNGARKALTLTGMSLLSYLNLNRYKVLYFVSELLRDTSLQRLPFHFTYEGRIFLTFYHC
jgi:hypothetical protein